MPSQPKNFIKDTLGKSLLSISAPYGESESSAASTRYRYDNAQRGEEPFVIIQRTISGDGLCRWRDRDWAVPPEHAFICLVPEASSYCYPPEAEAPWHFSWLNFYGPLPVMLCAALREERGPVLPLPSRSKAQSLFSHLVAASQQRPPRDPADISLASFAFLTEWKRLLDRPEAQTTDPVDAFIQICRTRFREGLGIKELADQTGWSREHLTRTFTDRMKISPARYLRKLRTEAARDMQQFSDVSWTETALRCGFPSVKALRRALAD